MLFLRTVLQDEQGFFKQVVPHAVVAALVAVTFLVACGGGLTESSSQP